jgi:uncharacterized membrane protein YeaQ/YmgE (transglycosylase-associated protein family)
MFSILVWIVYGVIVGSIAKALVPGEERFGFIKTVGVGIAGSYLGGAALYLLGKSSELEPAGIVVGIGGGALAVILYNKLSDGSKN